MEIDICPPWLMRRFGVPRDVEPHLGLFLSSAVALTISLVLVHLPHVCLLQRLLCVPCPGCGILHAMAALLHLNLVGAWHYNPAAIALAIMFSFQLVARPVAIVVPRTRAGISKMSHWGSTCALACLVAVWIWRIAH